MRGLADAHVWLLRALHQMVASEKWFQPWLKGAPGGGPTLIIEDFSEQPWASLTFRGTRHLLDVRLEGKHIEVDAALKRLEHLLEEPDVAIPGHFLAEIAITESKTHVLDAERTAVSLSVEALTIEE